MFEYLVRWKFGPNSLLNAKDEETQWYYQFHSTKDEGVNHYTTLLLYSVPVMKITVEIFKMTQLVPGEPEPEEEKYPRPEKFLTQVGTDNRVDVTYLERNNRIMEMHVSGYSTREIATQMDLSYQAVYGVIRKSKGK